MASKTGTLNAIVFPEAVGVQMITLLPSSARSMAFAWWE